AAFCLLVLLWLHRGGSIDYYKAARPIILTLSFRPDHVDNVYLSGRVFSPPTKLDLARLGSPASSIVSIRSSSSLNNIRISSRAMCRPRHWCAPAPKAR